jgi:hypothetical protein
MSLKTGGEVGEERLTQLSANWNLLHQPYKQEIEQEERCLDNEENLHGE